MGATAPGTYGTEDIAPTSFQWRVSIAIAALLVVVSLVALLFGRIQGPQIRPLIALAAGIWSLADMLTAFLLLAQFSVNGRRFFGLLAASYAFSGSLTWPYLAVFPELFRPVLTFGDEQTSIYLWSIWHCLFPLLIICATVDDSALRPIVSRKAIGIATAAFAIVPIVASAAIATLLFTNRASLPLLVVRGKFQPLSHEVLIPLIVSFNVLACIVLLKSSRLTPLKVCLALAAFSAALDGSLNLSASGYSYAWDTSKLITVFTGSVVLIMMLCDIARLYGRLAHIANVDVLTSLQNRRALEEHVTLAFHNARRLKGRLSLLVIDIDNFKHYNDSFGHSGGDECLRSVARAIATCVTRPLDMVARFGGEEFVVVLPDTPLQGVMMIAERIRTAVQDLDIAFDGKALGRVTVSVGVGYARDVSKVVEAALFEAADRGVYDAKAGGRNRVVVGCIDPADALEGSTLRVPSASDLGFAPE